MTTHSYPDGLASSRPERWRRLATIAADSFVATLTSVALFGLLTHLVHLVDVDIQLGSDDPAHENDAMFLVFVPMLATLLAAVPAGLLWLLSRGGRTPGARLSGCRLEARPPTTADDLLLAYGFWIAGPPVLIFGLLSIAVPAMLTVPPVIGLAALAITASALLYGRPVAGDGRMWIERVIRGAFAYPIGAAS